MFITQVVDPSDPNLGATTAKIAALARRFDEVVVVCDRGNPDALPSNCRVLTFGASRRLRRAYRYLRALGEEMRDPPTVFVAHMVPLYAVVAAPLVRSRRVPLMLWYTHWKAHAVLRLAAVASTHLLSLGEGSFPLRSRKVHAIGHGIDLDEFPCQPSRSERQGPLRVVALGRYSPPKKLDELIEGVRLARGRGVDARIDLYGTTGSPAAEVYKSTLERIVADPEYGAFASVGGPVPRTELPLLYAQADVVASDFISPDKVVLEACASCRPVLASDRSFDTLFAGIEPPLAFERGKPESFADRLQALAALTDEERHALGRTLRERVREQHSVDTWADAILRLANAS